MDIESLEQETEAMSIDPPLTQPPAMSAASTAAVSEKTLETLLSSMRSLQDRQNLAEQRIAQVEGDLSTDPSSLRTQLQRLDSFFIAGPGREHAPFANMLSEMIGTAMVSAIASAVSNERLLLSIGEQFDEREKAFKDWVRATFQPRQFVHPEPPAEHIADVEMNAVDTAPTGPGYSQAQYDSGTYPRFPVESEGRPQNRTLALSHDEFSQAIREGIEIAQSQEQKLSSALEVTSPFPASSDHALPQFQKEIPLPSSAGGSAGPSQVQASEPMVDADSPGLTTRQAQASEHQPQSITEPSQSDTSIQGAITSAVSPQPEQPTTEPDESRSAAPFPSTPSSPLLPDTQGSQPMEVDAAADTPAVSLEPKPNPIQVVGQCMGPPTVSDHATVTGSDIQAPPLVSGEGFVGDHSPNPSNTTSAPQGNDDPVDTVSDNESDVSDFTFS